MTSRLWRHLPNDSRCHRIFPSWNMKDMESQMWVQHLVIFTIEKYHCSFYILNLHVTFNKQKPYRSFLVIPDTISNENRWVIVTSSIHEPLAILMLYWPIILTLFLWTLSSQWHCQPGTFQPGGSSSLHFSQCTASFSWWNRNWPLIRSGLEWFVLPQRHSIRGALI